MKNNRGQILVLFIFMLPVILLLFGLIVDTGFLFIEKRNLDNNVKQVITYRFESDLDASELENVINNLLATNIDDISNTEINISNDYIKITVSKQYKSAFSRLFNKDIYEINTTYAGYINSGKLVIEKE